MCTPLRVMLLCSSHVRNIDPVSSRIASCVDLCPGRYGQLADYVRPSSIRYSGLRPPGLAETVRIRIFCPF